MSGRRFTRNTVAAVLLAGVLAGCGTVGDGSIGTLPVPDGATDCQHRVTTLQVRGMPWSPVTATSQITTLIGGKDRCPENLGVVVPTLQPLNGAGGGAAGLERLADELRALRDELGPILREAR